MEKFNPLEKLGEGTYGVVYKASDNNTGGIYALKEIRLQVDDEGIPSTAIREIALLKQLSHKNIVRLYDVVYTEKKLTLVFEYLEQDLKKYMDSCPDGIEPARINSFMRQLLLAVGFCHSNQVLHRDLKPQNLLVNTNGELKLADFGLARIFGVPVRSLTPEVITLWYRPPEILMGDKQYAEPVDMWSVGCIFAEMVNGRPLFTGQSDKEQLKKIVAVKGSPTLVEWPTIQYLPGFKPELLEAKHPAQSWSTVVRALAAAGQELLSKLLEYNPDNRWSAATAGKSEYCLQYPAATITPGSAASPKKDVTDASAKR